MFDIFSGAARRSFTRIKTRHLFWRYKRKALYLRKRTHNPFLFRIAGKKRLEKYPSRYADAEMLALKTRAQSIMAQFLVTGKKLENNPTCSKRFFPEICQPTESVSELYLYFLVIDAQKKIWLSLVKTSASYRGTAALQTDERTNTEICQ